MKLKEVILKLKNTRYINKRLRQAFIYAVLLEYYMKRGESNGSRQWRKHTYKIQKAYKSSK